MLSKFADYRPKLRKTRPGGASPTFQVVCDRWWEGKKPGNWLPEA